MVNDQICCSDSGSLLLTALNEALREEVQRLKVATGQVTNGSGQNLSIGGQLYQMQDQSFNPQQLQQLQQAQSALNSQQQQQQQQQQSSQQQMHSDFMQRGAFNLSSSFIKNEGSTIPVTHRSSASFG